MSGGFFRGTSADQDTRFSNKQAKLLKSQKFAPELENLVDMTKVKMDVMRPWIAKRVTELIGFEDEVLINFIYGLLEGKAVNGKQVQISLTGFMERNTGKFMKELWVLLLSAQQNVSGVPQQFLDAKEEETKKKKAETDRIANEIQRKKEKEKQEFEEEKTKMDGDGAKSRDKHNELEPNAKHEAGDEAAVEKERFKRNGRRRSSRGSQSPGSSYHSPPLRQKHSVLPNKSYYWRYSNGRRRSRSISRTPPSRGRSISLERRDRSSPRRCITPRRRHIGRRSPSPWRRSFHLRRRSRSHSRRRSPSPTRYRVRSPRRHRSRSPLRRRSRSPVRRRSRTPIQRSPGRYRSRTPLRRRSPSPMHGRSPSPIRGRSPFFARRRSPSPARRSSPVIVRRRSRSPFRRRSPSPRRQSPSPARRQQRRSLSRSISPVRRTSSMHGRKRSLSPENGRSPIQESGLLSPIHRSSLSPVRRGLPKNARSPIQSPEERNRRRNKYSPARCASPNGRAESLAEKRKETKSVERRPVVSLRSPQRDMLERRELRRERDLSPMEKSPFGSDASRGRGDGEVKRSISPRGSPYEKKGRTVQAGSPSPLREAADISALHDSSGTSVDDERKFSSRDIGTHRNRSSRKMSPSLLLQKDSLDTADTRVLTDSTKSRKTQLPNRDSDRPRSTVDHKEHRGRQGLSTTSKTTALSMKSRESYDDGSRAKDKKIDRADDGKGGNQVPELEGLHKLSKKTEQNDHNGSLDAPSMETDEHRGKIKEKRKRKKSERQDVESDDYSSSDSYEDRKEVKRRRREEKKLKKEDRRRRRDEKRRRKDERRTEKLKLKSGDAGSLSPDLGNDNSEDEGSRRRLRAGNTEKTESEQKRLEIELREKALESLRAKKGF